MIEKKKEPAEVSAFWKWWRILKKESSTFFVEEERKAWLGFKAGWYAREEIYRTTRQGKSWIFMTLEEQLKAAKRELAMRQRVYPRQLLQGKITEETMNHETNAMQSICDTLQRLVDTEGQQPNLFAEKEQDGEV